MMNEEKVNKYTNKWISKYRIYQVGISAVIKYKASKVKISDAGGESNISTCEQEGPSVEVPL